VNIVLLNKKRLVRKINGYPMLLDFNEPGISEGLMIYGKREVAETELVKEVVKPGMCVLDVGANIGYYTILTARLVGKQGRIYSYEPYEPSFQVLNENIRINNISDIVAPYNVAVSTENSVKKLHRGRGTNLHTLETFNNTNGSIEVTCVDIIDVLKNIGSRIDLLRMDIEGHEREIFSRFSDEVMNVLPRRILFEIHPIGDIDPDPSFTAPLQNMVRLGYRPETVVASQNVLAPSWFEKFDYYPCRNYELNNTRVCVYKDIKTDDLINIAARRPKMTRAILFKLYD
jgi:FkbM family methyltransferase